MKSEISHFYKIIITSIYDSGKTNFCLRYIENKHERNTLRTMGCDFFIKNIVLDNGESAKIRLIDTQSGERFWPTTNHLFKNVDGIIILYDITNRDTFETAINWSRRAKEDSDKVIAIIGNKIDLENMRQVTTEEGQNFANTYNFIFYETSTLNGFNVNECMKTIIQRIYEKDEKKAFPKINNLRKKRPRKEGCLK